MSVSVVTALYGPRSSVTLITSAGPMGPQGFPGLSAGDTIRTADQAISGGRVVRATSATGCDYADAATIAHLPIILGVTRGAAASGDSVNVVAGGEVTGLTGLTPGLPVYCGLNGALTQVFSGTWAFSRIVGFALSPTVMMVQLREPLALI